MLHYVLAKKHISGLDLSLVRDQAYGQTTAELRAMQEGATPLPGHALVPGLRRGC